MMEAIFVSDFFKLDDEFSKLGVFDAIINKDSNFFINLLRLKTTQVPHFSDSYNKINAYFRNIMKLLAVSKEKGDKFYKEALNRFSFSGVNGINLGFSETGVDAGFGKKLSKQVISDAFDIVKTGSEQPEIFQLVGLFEENVSADRLSDMIATLITEDIHEYTRWVNEIIGINKENYPDIEFVNDIAINPYKKCEILYLPIDILHELPIAKEWNDIDRVIAENKAIRAEVNETIGEEWRKMASSEKKQYLKEFVFKNHERCTRVISDYENNTIGDYDFKNNMDYFCAKLFAQMRKTGILDFLNDSEKSEISSWEASQKVLDLCKDFIENNKGWDVLHSVSNNKAEKTVQRLLHFSGKDYCSRNNIDLSFEPNEGPGPVDLKVSRGNDKTVIEIKLSTNNNYLHGFTDQIEDYARAENTNQRIYVYVQFENNPGRDEKIKQEYDKRKAEGKNPPLLYIIDARNKTSASKR